MTRAVATVLRFVVGLAFYVVGFIGVVATAHGEWVAVAVVLAALLLGGLARGCG